MSSPEIAVLPDPAAVAREAADRIVAAATEAVAATGRFSIALAGGSTPKALYQLLTAEPYRSQIDWAHFDTFAWRPAGKPGRPKGGDALGLRAAWRMLQARYG